MKHTHHHETAVQLTDLLMARNAVQSRRIRRVVITGCALNAFLMIMKLLVGWFGHSDALIADGFHSMNDVAVDIIMFVFIGISYKSASSSYAYGYGKYETLASVLISILMIFIATMICVEGIRSIVDYAHGESLEHPDIWTVFAIAVAIVTKECLYRFYSNEGREMESSALQGAGWHHRLDALSSIATLVGVSCAHFLGERFRVLDPVVSVLIGLLIYIPALRLLIPSFLEMMEHMLPKKEVEKSRTAILSVPGVLELKKLRARKSGHCRIFDITIRVASGTTVDEGAVIADSIERALAKAFCPHIFVIVATTSK